MKRQKTLESHLERFALCPFAWEGTHSQVVHKDKIGGTFSADWVSVTTLDIICWSPWILEKSSVWFPFAKIFATF